MTPILSIYSVRFTMYNSCEPLKLARARHCSSEKCTIHFLRNRWFMNLGVRLTPRIEDKITILPPSFLFPPISVITFNLSHQNRRPESSVFTFQFPRAEHITWSNNKFHPICGEWDRDGKEWETDDGAEARPVAASDDAGDERETK